jgi:hypothetical protein
MKRTIILAAVLAVGLAARADDARQVVEKAVKAHGGAEALKKHTGGEYKTEGTAQLLGEATKYTSTICYALPDKFKMTFDATVLDRKSVVAVIVNGDKIKETATLDGKPSAAKDPAKAEVMKAEYRQLAAIYEVNLLYPLLDADKFTLKTEPADKVDGKDAAVVLVSRKGMKDVKLFFDKDSGRLVKYTRKGLNWDAKEVDEEVVMSDFKPFDGVLLPTTHKVKQAGKDYMTVKVTDVKLTDKPDVKAFAID